MEWSEPELVVVVREYMAMLAAERAGDPYVKARHNERVCDATGRSRGSVEFKFCNVSAALQDLGHEWVLGYLPRDHYQFALREVVSQFMRDNHSAAGPESDVSDPEEAGLTFEDLWERASGGLATAVSPVHSGSGHWPVGPSAAGADEAIADLMSGLADSDATPQMLFLVGGPGNGKSALASQAASQLIPDLEYTAGTAERVYEYHSTAGRGLRLVNDATIPADGVLNVSGALSRDVDLAVGRGAFLLANINRGILLEERGRDQHLGESASGVLEWLAAHILRGEGTDGSVVPVTSTSMQLGPHRYTLRAVRMDVASLLERRPNVTLSPDGDTSDAYMVTRFDHRNKLSANDTPAGALLSDFVQRLIVDLPSSTHDPIAANLRGLAEPGLQARMLSIMRAGELVSARKLTYRELWGAFVRCVVGSIPDRFTPGQARDHLAQALVDAEGRTFADWTELASIRTHQALFAAPPLGAIGTLVRQDTSNPVVRIMRSVDPALDAVPEWSRVVYESIAFPNDSGSPLATLIEALPSAALVPDPFDLALDEAFLRHVASSSDQEVRRATSWYGRYLLRLYALSQGIPAFRAEVEAWTAAWASAKWPAKLKESLQTLVFPTRHMGAAMSLPVLEARATPVIDERLGARFVTSVSALSELKKVRRGDALFLHVGAEGIDVELELDIALLREAMACRCNRPGISDKVNATMPRLERFRASWLRADMGNGYAVLGPDGREYDVTIGDVV